MGRLRMTRDYYKLRANMEHDAMVETITDLESTREILLTAIKSALADPENWQTHLTSALNASLLDVE